ncbi:hypothetical protein [Halorussus salinisoli]|uniref:hypothetical protein n=1 Tax=Halorussus salinisoli TaxID=2558242 RepID=UPI0010C168DF|nr:hypothetical protein [Halorussus salinisoli]
MDNRRVGVLAGVVSVLGLAIQHVPSVILDRWISGGFDGAMPMVGTAGQTVVVYNLVTESVGPLVTLLLALGLGYYVSRRLDMGHEYRRFGRAVAVSSLVSMVGVWAVLLYGVQSTPLDVSGVLVSLAVFVRIVVTVSLVVTVGAFAGAALAHFRTNEETPTRPIDTGTGGPSMGTQKSTTDDADAQSATE